MGDANVTDVKVNSRDNEAVWQWVERTQVPRRDVKFRIHEGTKRTGHRGQQSTWLVGDVPNAGDHVYCDRHDSKSEGFGGAEMRFNLFAGSEYIAKGPWHSNPQALFEDTGVDVRDKHYTRVVIGREAEVLPRGGYVMKDVLHLETEPVLGQWDRYLYLAETKLVDLPPGAKVRVFSESMGGSVLTEEMTLEDVRRKIANAKSR